MNEKAEEIKRKILPTKVQIVDDDAFGFASSESAEARDDYGNENGFIDEEQDE